MELMLVQVKGNLVKSPSLKTECTEAWLPKESLLNQCSPLPESQEKPVETQ